MSSKLSDEQSALT